MCALKNNLLFVNEISDTTIDSYKEISFKSRNRDDDRLNKMAPTENISSSSQRSSGPLYQRISNARYNALKAFNYN